MPFSMSALTRTDSRRQQKSLTRYEETHMAAKTTSVTNAFMSEMRFILILIVCSGTYDLSSVEAAPSSAENDRQKDDNDGYIQYKDNRELRQRLR